MPDEKREQDATDWMTREIADKAEPAVLAALARDSAANVGLTDRERSEMREGRVSPEAARKIAQNTARDLENRRRR
jgi:hypothetical protein